jgi:predicted GNAT family acetyltransferase
MNIKNVEKNGRGAFLIRNEDGERVAEMTYVKSGDSAFIIDHTEADPSLRGQGVADKLLDAAAAHARENKLKIHATCPFALKKLQNETEFADVFGG